MPLVSLVISMMHIFTFVEINFSAEEEKEAINTKQDRSIAAIPRASRPIGFCNTMKQRAQGISIPVIKINFQVLKNYTYIS